jgi:hypothetical protein
MPHLNNGDSLALLHWINWEKVVIHNHESRRGNAICADCNADHGDDQTEDWNTTLSLNLRLDVDKNSGGGSEQRKRAVDLGEAPAERLVAICRNVDALLDRSKASYASTRSCGENANDGAQREDAS